MGGNRANATCRVTRGARGPFDKGQARDAARQLPPPGLDLEHRSLGHIRGQEAHADASAQHGREITARQLADALALSRERVARPQWLAPLAGDAFEHPRHPSLTLLEEGFKPGEPPGLVPRHHP